MFLRTAFAVTLSAIVPFLVILTLCEPNWWTQPIFTSYFENILLTRNNDATNLLLLLCVKCVTISYSAFYNLSLTLHDSNEVHPLYILRNKSVLPICQKVNVHWTFENARLCWMKQAFFFFFLLVLRSWSFEKLYITCEPEICIISPPIQCVYMFKQ